MYKHPTYSLLLALGLLSSCAIHTKFPFICFKKDCIKNQFRLDPHHAFRKKINTKIFLIKRKFKRKSKTEQNDPKFANSKDQITTDIKDSTDNNNWGSGYNVIKLVFESIDSLSVIDNNSFNKKDSVALVISNLNLTDDNKQAIRSYINTLGLNQIQQIKIIANTTRYSESSSEEISLIVDFLIKERVRRRIIKIIK